jgi:hypothetical protein
MIITDDDDDDPDDLPAATDLFGWALPSIRLITRPADDSVPVADVLTAPAVAGLVLGHHCDGLEPSACARPFNVQPCRYISPQSADVQPEVVVISDDEAIPIAPVIDTPSPALPLNIFQYAALHGQCPSVAAPAAVPIAPVVAPALPLNIFQYAALHGQFPSVAAPPAAVVTPHSDVSVFADSEARHGDSTSSGSSGSSGSELSGDFVDHAEPALRRKDRQILEQFFPLTCKRLRLARVAPNLLASRPRKQQRAVRESALTPPTNGEFEVVD